MVLCHPLPSFAHISTYSPELQPAIAKPVPDTSGYTQEVIATKLVPSGTHISQVGSSGDWHLADRFTVQLHVGTVALLPRQPSSRLNRGGVSETDREIGGQGGPVRVQFH